jgi:hypothetical protein
MASKGADARRPVSSIRAQGTLRIRIDTCVSLEHEEEVRGSGRGASPTVRESTAAKISAGGQTSMAATTSSKGRKGTGEGGGEARCG